jgi:hypothetical protein
MFKEIPAESVWHVPVHAHVTAAVKFISSQMLQTLSELLTESSWRNWVPEADV